MRFLLLFSLLLAVPASAQRLDPDSTFGSNGTALVFGSGFVQIVDHHVDRKDRVVLLANGNTPDLLFRLTPDGQLDTSFGSDGLVRPAAARVVGTDAFDRVLVARKLNASDLHFTRYTEDGLLDTSFGVNGTRVVPFGTGMGVDALERDGDRWYVALTFFPEPSGPRRCALAALTGDGVLDPTFGIGGVSELPAPAACTSVAVRPSAAGVALLGRYTDPTTGTGAAIVGAFTAEGVPQPGFGTDGRATFTPAEGSFTPTSLAAWANRIAVGGTVTAGGVRSPLVFALATDGAPDPTFNGTGVWTAATPGVTNNERLALAVADGDVLVATTSLYQPVVTPGPGRSGILATAFTPDGARVDLGGTEGFRFVELILGDAIRSYRDSWADVDTQGRVVVAGSYGGASGQGAVATRLVWDAGTTVTGEALPVAAGALTVAPNPSAGDARVALTLDAPTTATVRIVDALGRTVATLADGALGVGTHTFATGRLAPGVYAIVAEAEGGRAVARMSVAR